MTSEQLQSVRFLRAELEKAREELRAMRQTTLRITPLKESLPPNKNITSQVEALALKILKQETRIKGLEAAVEVASAGLTGMILTLEVPSTEQTIIIMRYVEGLSFREISLQMKMGMRQVFRLHEGFKRCHLTAQDKA